MPNTFKVKDLISVDYKIKDFFFDRDAIEAQLTKLERRAMSKIGAYVRTSARQSIRRRKGTSPPGAPPYAHNKSKVYTIKNILFGYDPQKHNVIIGPTYLKQGAKGGPVIVPDSVETIPALLEYGGRAEARFPDGTIEEYNYAPRPFMAPALERERSNGKLIEAWKELL
jgi:hypothetical protein